MVQETISKLLVTGGYGFIGSNFIRSVINKYDSLINVDKLTFGSNETNLIDLKNFPNYQSVKGDITDNGLLQVLIENVDAIINFAAESHVDRSISNPEGFVRTNILGVYSILEAIRKCRKEIRLVHIGSDEEYGEILTGSFAEKDRFSPSSPYAASKAAASVLINAYHRTYGIDAVITRCTNNFGPYQFPEKLIPKTIIRAKLGLKVPIYGSGMNVRDWIYVSDHCEAIDAVLQHGDSGETYNVSSGYELTNLEVVSTIFELMQKPFDLIEYVEDRPGHDLRYSISSSKIREQLGWRPKYTFRAALEKTLEWYLSNEDWWRPLVDDRVLHPTPWKLKW
jgi:dTDP-glucose 4,6-dehydratase